MQLIFPLSVYSLDARLKSEVKQIEAGENLIVKLTFSEPVLRFSPEMLSTAGGGVVKVVKLSTLSYKLYLKPQEDSKEISVQLESDKVEDLNRNKNENASNEILVKILKKSQIQSEVVSSSLDFTKFSSVLARITGPSNVSEPFAPTLNTGNNVQQN